MGEEIIPDALVELRRVHAVLTEILAHPERYQIQQSEADMGTATMPTLDKPQHYNRISCNAVFVDKTKLPASLHVGGEGVDV